MMLGTILIGGAVAAVLAAAVVHLAKNRHHGCNGDCGKCGLGGLSDFTPLIPTSSTISCHQSTKGAHFHNPTEKIPQEAQFASCKIPSSVV